MAATAKITNPKMNPTFLCCDCNLQTLLRLTTTIRCPLVRSRPGLITLGYIHRSESDGCQTILHALSILRSPQISKSVRFTGQSGDELRAIWTILFFEHCKKLAIAGFQLVGLAPLVVEIADAGKRDEQTSAIMAE